MSSKSYPKRVKFFIADDIRSDGPKPMIIGLFVDDSVGLVMPAGNPDPTKEAPIMLQSLAILTSFIDCNGSFEAETSLYQPDGTAIFEHQKIEGGINSDNPTGKNNINFITKFMPCAIPKFGVYEFSIKLDEKKYDYKFTIGRAHSSK